jgi:competence protein ComGC
LYAKLRDFAFFTLFYNIFVIFTISIFRRITMPKAITKEQVKSKTKAEPKKLSKAALWWKKHPNGLDVIIHDMRAVMR